MLQLREPFSGPDHADILPILYDLTLAFWHQTKYREAHSVISRVLRVTEDAYGAHDQRIVTPLLLLARLLQMQQRVEEAKLAMTRFLSVVDQLSPHEQMTIADIIQHSATLLGSIGQAAAAARLAGQLAMARQRN